MSFITLLAWIIGLALLAAVATLGYFVLATRRIAAQAEKLVPATGHFIEVAGNRIHYMEAGSGRPIVFLHGLGGQLHHFRHTLFERLAGDFRLITLDRPGSGYSVRAAAGTGRLSEQAEVIARFIDKLGLEKPLLVGHSLGGAIALATALEHGEKISGLALLSPLTHLEDAIPPAFRLMYIRSPWQRRLISYTVGVPRSLKHANQTLNFVFGPQKAPEDYAIEAGGLAGLRPSHFLATLDDFMAIEHDLGRFEERYEELAMPVGVMFGTADCVIDYERNGLALQGRIAGLELELVDGMGHMPQFVEPDRVEAFIRRMAAKSFAA